MMYKKKKELIFQLFFVAEVLEYEPKMTKSEFGVLPLHYTSILNFREKCLSNFFLISIRVTILI